VSRSLQIENGLRSIDPGAEVVGVDAESPAEQGRLQTGDVITHAGGKPVRNQEDLDTILREIGVSEQINLSILRQGERQDVDIPIIGLPRGYLGFEVVPLSERESLRQSLPGELAALDSLPVVSWVQHDMPKLNEAKLDSGSVIIELGRQNLRSVADFKELADSIRIGDVVVLRFYSQGKYRHARFLAQAPPKPWSGLRLEEMSPMLVEAESLSVAGGEATGLFVRKVESESPAERAGIRPRDRILNVGGSEVSSTDQFNQYYSEISNGRSASLLVAHDTSQTDTLPLERWSKLEYIREEPVSTTRLMWLSTQVAGRLDVGWVPVLPFPYWTKVTGPRFYGFAGISLRHKSRQSGRVEPEHGRVVLPESRVLWSYDYGLDDKHWHHSCLLEPGLILLPTVGYSDGPMPFYHEQISNGIETFFLALAAGEDRLSYVKARGWTATWTLTRRQWEGHRFVLELSFLRHDAIPNPNMSRPSWISGRKRFTPNPVEGVSEGRFNTGTLRYAYSNANWRQWTRALVDAEVRVAGGPLRGDYQFVRCEANGSGSLRLARRLYLDTRLRVGLAGGALPLQEEFYVGGPGTLPGRKDREFSGNRTILVHTQVSCVPLGKPEKSSQLRVFVGLDAGNAWQSIEQTGIPVLRSDISIGIGYFGLDNAFLSPFGLAIYWATPTDKGYGQWRFHLNVLGAVPRWTRGERYQ
jgi:S1-C subfamily serine protease